MSSPGRWLDPEPPHAEHSSMQCRLGLPKPRDIDNGRRYQCEVCQRVYRVHAGDQREPGAYFSEVPQ